MINPMLAQAKKYMGIHEKPGPASDAFIAKCLARCGYAGQDDSRIPWCGCFQAEIASEVGFPYPQEAAAAVSWSHWGIPLDDPKKGCIVVFEWDSGGHHVALVNDFDDDWLYCLGGNQKDSVNITTFGYGSVIAFRDFKPEWIKSA